MSNDPQNPALLLDRLIGALKPRARVMTAFSGGVDSTVVAVAARQALGKHNAPAVIGDSLSLPRHELQEARQLAATLDLELIQANPHEQDDPGYQANRSDRCYFCKTHLYSTMRPIADAMNITFIANGTNTDDLSDHRPGLTAASEHNIISPLVDAGLNKNHVRLIARHLGLANADKPAAACLSSRLAYGLEVTPQRLAQVEAAEAHLRSLGFTGLRVRHHDTLARVELPEPQIDRALEPQIRARIVQGLKEAGFTYVTIDLEGFRSGSSNLVLTRPTISIRR